MVNVMDLRLCNKVYITPLGVNTVYEIGSLDFAQSICDNYNPIPLTPEILEKCGFVWNENLNGYELSGWLPFHIEKITTITEWYFLTTFKHDWKIGKKFKYLHQLQNLYYVLENKELQIKTLTHE